MADRRVTDVSLRPFDVTLDEPLATAAGTIDAREGWLVRVRTESEGGTVVTGVGEATPLPGWTESREESERALREAADAATGPLPEARAVLDGLGPTPAARHGLALALADAAARREGRPLYAHLGGEAASERLPVNATVGDAAPAETVERARAAVRAGFEWLKLKVGARSVAADLDRIAAVSEALGDGVALRADANAAWDRKTARRALDAVAERGLDLEYVEQPLGAEDLAGHARLRDRERERPGGGTGVALDESVAATSVERALEADAADRLVLKPMVLGGPDRTLRAADRAARAGVPATVTSTVDAVVARTAAVHVAAGVETAAPSRAPTAHGLATAGALAEDLAPDPAPVANGTVRVPDTAGTGVDPEVFAS